jgi:hypothetical protein
VEDKTKVQALSLANECVINKLELLISTVVDDAIRFVAERSREIAKKPKSSSYASSTENIKNPKNLVITMKKGEKNK